MIKNRQNLSQEKKKHKRTVNLVQASWHDEPYQKLPSTTSRKPTKFTVTFVGLLPVAL